MERAESSQLVWLLKVLYTSVFIFYISMAGNHVVNDCQGATVLLAHMQNGSVILQSGDAVTTGQPLGLVDNSGNTSEPHLHIHAVRAGSGGVLHGAGIPMTFEGRFPARNTIFVDR